MAGGLSGSTPVAMVENTSLLEARRFHTRLDLLPLAARTALSDGPAIILVGEAVRGHAEGAATGTVAAAQADEAAANLFSRRRPSRASRSSRAHSAA